MTRRVGWLLTEIERQADGKMSDLARCELVAEVADHLDAAIQARMEIGIGADEAELQAVKEFGPPKAYVKDLLKVHRPKPSKDIWKGDRSVLTVFWVGFAVGLGWLVSAPKYYNAFYFFGACAIFLTVFSIACFRSRCFRPLPLAKASFAAFFITAMAITLTWHNLWVHGGTGLLPDWEASTYLAQDSRNLAALDADMQLLKTGVRVHLHPGRVLSKDDEAMLLTAPDINPSLARTLNFGFIDPDDDNRIRLRPVQTIEEAKREWEYAGAHILPKVDGAKDRYLEQVNAIKDAKSSWLLADLRQNLADSIAEFPFLFLVCSFFNAIFGWLGWLVANYRIIRRRRA